MTYKELLILGQDRLGQQGILDSPVDAQILFEYVTGISRQQMMLKADTEALEEQVSTFLDCISKRATGRPVQYITGQQCFYGYDFYVDERVLIPRFDTEILVEQLLKVLRPGDKLLDMCTGSGCILITAMKKVADISGVGADISAGALEVARRNADSLMVSPKLIESDLFDQLPIDDQYQVIVSNPPYIETSVIDELMREVKDHEPYGALDGGEDGLIFYRRIIEQAPSRLTQGGYLLFEIGYNQGKAVQEFMLANGFTDVRVIKDYASLDRVVIGQRS